MSQGSAEINPLKTHTRVGQGEQGDDDEGAPWLELVLETVQGCHRLVGDLGEHHRLVIGVFVTDVALDGERVEDATTPGVEFPGRVQRPVWGEESQGDTGDGGMNPRLEGGVPDDEGETDVVRHRSDLHFLREPDREEPSGGDRQPTHRDVAAVEDGDDQDGPDIVGDRQCEEKQLGRGGNPGAEQCHDPDGEGDVGRHRYAPSM